MTESEKDIWLIIAEVWNGNATSEEKRIFDQWLNENEENKQFYNAVNHIVPLKKQYEEETKSRVYSKIKEAIMPKQAIRKIRFWRYSTAASIAVIFVLGTILLNRKTPLPSVTTYIEAQTPFGIKSKIFLPDGTTVYLNSGSYLKYPARFSDEQRQVILKGEAYFEVNKDLRRPFIVQTEQINIKVFGTHFNLKAYKEDGVIETTLVEGSVGVFKKSDVNQKYGVKLEPNEQAVYNTNSDKIYLRKVDAELSTVWKDGKYYFENETLAVITKKLERNFNVNIRITSQELNKELFYGLFAKNKNIFQLLNAMKIHNNFNYTIKNDTIFIKKNVT